MSTRLSTRTRRSVLALITGATTALMLTVSSATAAPLDRSTDTGTQAAADIFIKDHPSDEGFEPHSYGPLWESSDIKVCTTAVECPVSQNPIVGQRNYVWVTLRNPGPYANPVTEIGQLRVYRTLAGGGAIWPGGWTEIGWKTVPVAPGVTKVVIPWDNVPGPGHFCLLARWESPNDPMNLEGPDINLNTKYNNNIAWRNVQTVLLVAGGVSPAHPFHIGNTLDRATRNSIVFSEPGLPLRTAGGRVVATLDGTLYQRWVEGGQAGQGVRDLGRNQIEIVDPGSARLDNLVLYPKERLGMTLNFSATTVVRESMPLRVTQYGPDSSGAERADLGGVRYDVTVVQK